MIFGYDRRNRFKCKTDLKIKSREWDFRKQEMKQGFSGSQVFNSRLRELKQDIETYYNVTMQANPEITFNQLKPKIKTFVDEKQKPNFEDKGTGFFDIFEKYISANKVKVSERTIQKYKTLKKSLLSFSTQKKEYNNLTFSQVDLNFYDAYRLYLLTEVKNPKTGKKGYLNDTVSKYIENLKHFMKWSLERDFHKNRDFQKSAFSASRKPKQDIVTLEFSELRDFYKYDFSNNKRLEQVRDLFCFAAFTGQRWGDIENFKKEDVKGDTWGFESQKTGKKTVIPLLGYIAPALDILKKYDFKFPIISNQKFNDYIKEAAKIAELDRMIQIERLQGIEKIKIEKPLHDFISMHTGRRTCVSLLLNVEKMPIPQVMDITQHSDFKTLRKYINEDPAALRKNLLETRSVDFEMKIVKKKAQ
jgi:integrase